MKKFLTTVLLLSAATWCLPARAAAQSAERPSVRGTRTTDAPRLDGNLNEPAWETAELVDDFTQQEPNLGESPTERTEVRVLFDSGHLYIGVHAYDSQPSAITATEMRRDADRLLAEDSFQFVLDTFNDSRNGYLFATTPLGAKLEEQISEEGEGSSRGNSNNSNVNRD